MTEKEIASYAASAVQDSTFVKNHPELFKKIKLKGLGGRETLEATSEPAVDAKQIATAYLQEYYNNKHPKKVGW
jgi:hypothetical protein